VAPLLDRKSGMVVIDDTTLDKPYALAIALVTRHWSGKHRAVVQGINLVSLVWTDGTCRLPCDFLVYNKNQDQLSKDDHFRPMILQAQARCLTPPRPISDFGMSNSADLQSPAGQ